MTEKDPGDKNHSLEPSALYLLHLAAVMVTVTLAVIGVSAEHP